MVLKGQLLSGDQGQIIVVQDNPQGTGSFTDLYRAARHNNIPIDTIVSLLDAAAGISTIGSTEDPPEVENTPAVEIPVPTPEPETLPAPKPSKSKSKETTEKPAEEQEITSNDLLEALKPILSFDRPRGLAILAEHGAEKISDVNPKDYTVLLAQLKEAVA